MHSRNESSATRVRQHVPPTAGASLFTRLEVNNHCVESPRASLRVLRSLASMRGMQPSRSVRTLVPPGFLTPFRAIVSRRQDFVCRAEFCWRVMREKKGDLYYFTYAGDNSIAPEAAMHLRSEQATVVIDTMM